METGNQITEKESLLERLALEEKKKDEAYKQLDDLMDELAAEHKENQKLRDQQDQMRKSFREAIQDINRRRAKSMFVPCIVAVASAALAALVASGAKHQLISILLAEPFFFICCMVCLFCMGVSSERLLCRLFCSKSGGDLIRPERVKRDGV